MSTVTRYLIVRADGSARITTRRPGGQRRLRVDEVAYALRIAIPDAWGSVYAGAIEVALPEPPAVALDADPALPLCEPT